MQAVSASAEALHHDQPISNDANLGAKQGGPC